MSANTAIQIDGESGTSVRQEGAVAIISALGIGAGSFQRLPGLRTTNSLAPVLYWTAPFEVLEAGDTLLSMVWNVFFVPTIVAVSIIGGAFFSADVDGVALVDTSGSEWQWGGGAIWNTVVVNGTYQAVAAGLTAGIHTANIFWNVNDVRCTATSAANEANLLFRRV